MSTPPLPPCTACKSDSPTPAYTGGTTTATRPGNARTLLSDTEFNGVMWTVLDNNPGMEPGLAGRIVVNALAFLATAAQGPQSGLVPSRVVDEGWHALVLHTALYQSLCARLCGGFIHHVPERPDPANRSHSSVERTVAAIEAAGYTVDADLWRGPEDSPVTVAASCRHSDDGGPIVIIPKPKG